MEMSLLLIGGTILLFVLYVIYNNRKVKAFEKTPESPNIKTLNNRNFKDVVRSGIVLVDFWAPWCGPCRMMAPVLSDIANTDSDKVLIGKVNVDHQQQLAQRYKIRNIPTLVMFKNGKEVKRFLGVQSKKKLLNEVNEFLN